MKYNLVVLRNYWILQFLISEPIGKKYENRKMVPGIQSRFSQYIHS